LGAQSLGYGERCLSPRLLSSIWYQKGKQPSFCDFLISVICGCCARLLVEVVAIPADFTPLFFGKIIGAIFRPIVRLSQPSIREYIAVPAQQLPVDQTKRIEQS
jgi:hypothetical protein